MSSGAAERSEHDETDEQGEAEGKDRREGGRRAGSAGAGGGGGKGRSKRRACGGVAPGRRCGQALDTCMTNALSGSAIPPQRPVSRPRGRDLPHATAPRTLPHPVHRASPGLVVNAESTDPAHPVNRTPLTVPPGQRSPYLAPAFRWQYPPVQPSTAKGATVLPRRLPLRPTPHRPAHFTHGSATHQAQNTDCAVFSRRPERAACPARPESNRPGPCRPDPTGTG